ncbi:arsenate reductase (glutaredoxin) [Moheibacter sp.]|uniref:arsenate reductase (glutaredoxin) n=1 Tax=Moheibacter sp. TaxID=1965316 RepID=UPI003C781725
MIQIYHNTRCSTSRQGLEFVKDSGKDFEVIEYMKNPLKKEELKKIIQKLKISPVDLIRKKESIWKEHYEGKDLSDDKLIDLMVEFPNLMERPIVVNGNKAIIGRPPMLIKDIL